MSAPTATTVDTASPPLPRAGSRYLTCHSINWVTIANLFGAIFVVFACVWFFVDWWPEIGPLGVLGVAAACGTAFAIASRWLARTGFSEASGIAAILGVALVPVMAWSAESVTGLWTSHPHLVAGIALILLYVLWPAFSVFRSFARFPALLAFVGALLIAATVWTQRTFPELARRVAATRDPGDRRGLPGPAWIPWIIVAAFLLLTVARASSR